MKPIHTVVMLALAVSAASAFAGPDWEVINHARQVGAQMHVASAASNATPHAMDEACAQMMRLMTESRSASSVPVASAEAALFGERAPDASATRTVIVRPGTKAIPVLAGETVGFHFGTASATWHFAAQSVGESVDLGMLFPDIPLAQGVWAYPRADQFNAGH